MPILRVFQLPSSPYQVVYEAIKAGCRLLDGACDYGNEKEAGEGVRRAIQDGIIKREELCELSSAE